MREVPFYSLRRSVPALCIYGKNQGWVGATPPQDAPERVPVWVRATLGVGRPQTALPQALLPLASWQVGPNLISWVHLAWHARFL